MKQRFSSIFLAVSAASLLMVSATSFAGHDNYKGEANFKAEVPPPCPPILMLHDGFYIGGGVGYDSARIRLTSDTAITDIGTGGVFTQYTSARASATGWMGGIFLGYGRYFDWFYMGAELSGNFSSANASSTYYNSAGVVASLDGRLRSSYGIALLPGMKINDSTLFYVRLGYLRSNVKVSGNFTFVDPVDATFNTFIADTNNWSNGFQYGVGLESYVAEDVSVRGEFTHTNYNSKTLSFAFSDGEDTVTHTTKAEPSNNEYMLSLIYHFTF